MSSSESFSTVSAETLNSILGNAPVQVGPLRHYETYKRCASRGCGVQTYYKLQGVPYCTVHTIRKMNDMLVELGVES